MAMDEKWFLEDLLEKAKSAQQVELNKTGKAACVEITKSTKVGPLVMEKNAIVESVMNHYRDKYGVTFSADVKNGVLYGAGGVELVTIEDAASYVYENKN
ncbi:hypothetical protein [Luteibacter yeojuensis]